MKKLCGIVCGFLVVLLSSCASIRVDPAPYTEETRNTEFETKNFAFNPSVLFIMNGVRWVADAEPRQTFLIVWVILRNNSGEEQVFDLNKIVVETASGESLIPKIAEKGLSTEGSIINESSMGVQKPFLLTVKPGKNYYGLFYEVSKYDLPKKLVFFDDMVVPLVYDSSKVKYAK